MPAHIVCSGTYNFTAREPDCIDPSEFLQQVEDTLCNMHFKDTPIKAVIYEGRQDPEYLKMLQDRYGISRSD